MTQAALADAIGVSRGYISEVANLKKAPSLDVLQAICAYLGVTESDLTGTAQPSGLSEDPSPYLPDGADRIARATRALAEGVFQPAFWKVEEDMPGIGLCKGDVAVVEHRATEPRVGDLVLVQYADDNGFPHRAFRLYAPPWLIGGRSMTPEDTRSNSRAPGILGPVVGLVRARDIAPKALPAPAAA